MLHAACCMLLHSETQTHDMFPLPSQPPASLQPAWGSPRVIDLPSLSATHVSLSATHVSLSAKHASLSAFLNAFERHVHVHDCWKLRPECSIHVWRFMCGDVTSGSEAKRTSGSEARGPEDQRIRGPEDQR